jgi:hypothetical protein
MSLRCWPLALLSSIACATSIPSESRSAQRPVSATNAVEGTGALQRWDELSARYIRKTFEHDPGFAVAQGAHEFDGRTIDLSRDAIAAWVDELERIRAEAQAFDGQALDRTRRFEQKYMLANIDGALFWSARLREHERNPMVYASALDPVVYLTREYAPLETRLAAFVAHANGFPRVIDSMIANLRTPLPRTYVELGLTTIGGLLPYFERDVPQIFARVTDPKLQAELASALAVAGKAIARAKSYFEAQKPHANDEFALGPELFRELLWATERVDTPLEALRYEAQRDMEQNLVELKQACSKLAADASLSECARLVNEHKPSEGPVQAAREQVSLLKRFVVEHDLVSIPGAEQARVEEAPPYKRWNQAYIEIPGPYERGLPSTYYIAPPDPKWSADEQKAYLPGVFDLLYISAHEVWPGHFLQFLHANRAPRAFGRVFVGYAFAEGWAHYVEQLMADEGLMRDEPEARVGQLLNALLRNVRFVSALGLHTTDMRVNESERLFREYALCDAANARQQAARGTFDPAYLNYTMGKLMIRKLRDEWTAPRGGRASYRAFHDRLLSYGGPPLPLVREAMLADPPP